MLQDFDERLLGEDNPTRQPTCLFVCHGSLAPNAAISPTSLPDNLLFSPHTHTRQPKIHHTTTRQRSHSADRKYLQRVNSQYAEEQGKGAGPTILPTTVRGNRADEDDVYRVVRTGVVERTRTTTRSANSPSRRKAKVRPPPRSTAPNAF